MRVPASGWCSPSGPPAPRRFVGRSDTPFAVRDRTTPPSAASCSGVANRAGSSPSSARSWAALTWPLRGRLCRSGPSGCWSKAAAMAADSRWIWVTTGVRIATSAWTSSPLASVSPSPVRPSGASRSRARGGAAAAVGVAAEELRQAALAEALGALGRRVAGQEGQSNWEVALSCRPVSESRARFPRATTSQTRHDFICFLSYPRRVAGHWGPCAVGGRANTPGRTANLTNLSPPTGELPTTPA